MEAEPRDLIDERVATMSCKAAVKGNHTLSFAEADKLIDELSGTQKSVCVPTWSPNDHIDEQI